MNISKECRLGTKPLEIQRRLQEVFVVENTQKSTVYEWCSRFKKGQVEFHDKPRTGHPSEVDDVALRENVEANTRQATRELETVLGCSHTSVRQHLKSMGKVNKLGDLVPHELNEAQQAACVTISASHLSSTSLNLSSLVTGDEKWIIWVNIHRKRQWVDNGSPGETDVKMISRGRKVMLSCWWNSQGMFH